ncbi:hemerythrin domain-containing protein [Amycolatopsis samaneae]|uniref:Hemerythrin domain-containing protein n=1 Tax=Amycolatopsis samaneae TaxID=664691 RepID=A0ABW5GXT9_9PSEU
MSRDRVTAWKFELQTIHHRLERELKRARRATKTASLSDDLLAHCYGFCSALTDHHVREDKGLFIRLLAEHPDLKPTIEQLKADHLVLAGLITEFEQALDACSASGRTTNDDLHAHLDQLHLRMSEHFGREEATLNAALDKLVTTRDEAHELVGDGQPRPRRTSPGTGQQLE